MKRMLLLSGFLFIIAQGRAQFVDDYDFDLDLLGKGARAAGMGYAFNAVADDATALSWNPAGIMQIKNPELAFSNSLKNTEYRHARYEYDYNPVYTIDFWGFVFPVKLKSKNLVFGVSYQNKWNFKFDYENLPSETSIQYGKNTLTVNSVSLSCAYSINRFIGVGISYNKWFSLGNKLETFELYYDKKIVPEAPEKYPDESVYTITRSYKYSGNNITLGILFDLSEWHFPLRYTLKYDSRMWLEDDNNYLSRIDYNYYDGADTTWLDSKQTIDKFEYPGILTNGFAYRVGDYLTVACDFDIHLFNENIKISDYSWNYSIYRNNQKDTLINEVVHDTGIVFYNDIAFNQCRIGLEYILHPEFGFISIRAGWKSNYEEKSTYWKTFKGMLLYNKAEITPVSRVKAYSINFGTGITLKHFSIDLAYEAYWWQRFNEYFEMEKNTSHSFVLSTIWYIK
jgi:hypothetical protein